MARWWHGVNARRWLATVQESNATTASVALSPRNLAVDRRVRWASIDRRVTTVAERGVLFCWSSHSTIDARISKRRRRDSIVPLRTATTSSRFTDAPAQAAKGAGTSRYR